MAVVENLRSKLLYKIELRLLKIIPMILAFTALLNSILSYFNIDLYILSYIGSISIFTMVFLYLSSYVIVFWFMDDDYQYEKKVEKFYMN